MTPDEITPKAAAPRKAKTSARTKTASKSKSKPKTKKVPAPAAGGVTYAAATTAARPSRTAQALPALEMFQNQAATAPPPIAVAFVSIPGFDTAQTKLSETLRNFMDKVGSAIDEATTLKVKTYVSDDIEGVKLDEHGNLTGDMHLRAMTQIDLDGDIVAVIPMRPEGMDETLWAAHVDMVKQAQANRTELVKLAVSAVSGLVTIIKPV